MSKQRSTSKEITIATSNIHFGDMIRAEKGLAPFRRLAPDVLLLQEVINDTIQAERRLSRAGYKLVHLAEKYGLALAIRIDSGFSVVPDSIRVRMLQPMNPLERTLAQRFAGRSHTMTAHGMQAIKLQMEGRHVLTVVNTRTTVSSNLVARSYQVARMGKELKNRYYDGPLILGGDMNHYPSAQRVDKAMRRRSGLQVVDIGGEPTWRASNAALYRILSRAKGIALEDFSGQLDALLYRGEGLGLDSTVVVDTISDHRAIVGKFCVTKSLRVSQTPENVVLSR